MTKLLLDAGPFLAALEYACDVEAEILGKRSQRFFSTAVWVNRILQAKKKCWMIGDDAFADVEGALAAGLRALSVQ